MTASAPQSPRGFGALLLTEVDRVDLGTHHGQALSARVERRSARLTAGGPVHTWPLNLLWGRAGGSPRRRWQLSLGLGRTRPLALEVTADGRRYDLPVPRRRDPAWRLLALSLAAALLLAFAARRRTTPLRQEGGPHG